MNFEKFTDRSKVMLQKAQTFALAKGHQKFSTEHVLYGLFEVENDLVSRIISACGANLEKIKLELERLLSQIPSVSGGGAGQLYMSSEIAKVFEKAEELSKHNDDSFITIESSWTSNFRLI